MGLQKVAFNFMVERGGKLVKSLLCSKPVKKLDVSSLGVCLSNGNIHFQTEQAAINYIRHRLLDSLNRPMQQQFERAITKKGTRILAETNGTRTYSPPPFTSKEISERYNLPEQGKNIPGWKFVPPAEGTLSDYYKEEGSTVTYKYEKIKYGKVTVKHIVDDEFEEDGTTNKVLKEDSDIKEVGTQYSFQPESFAGYEFANKIEGGNSGIYEEEDKTVIFHYKKVEKKETGKVIILYVDENGKELERKVSTDVVGEGYSFQETDIIKDIPGYKYITYEGELTGEYKKEDTIIYCKYESIKYGNLIVLCIDENNNIIKRTVTTMEVGTNYNLGEVGEEIPGYEFLGVEGETSGKYKLEDTIVTYRYKHKKSEPSTSEVTKPKTGDVITKYIGIAAGAVVVLIILLVIGKKRNKDDK